MSLIEIRMPDEANEGTEASLGRWVKKTGDFVSEHEPLIEISTDKVTLEIPAPASGILADVRKTEGDAIAPGDLLGHINTNADIGTGTPTNSAVESAQTIVNASLRSAVAATDEGLAPAVRRIIAEHNLDPRRIPKLGRGSRLTLEDVRSYLADREATEKPHKAFVGQGSSFAGRKVPHTPMRKSIANHMAWSMQNAPHVTAVFEADLSSVLSDRAARKQMAEDGEVPSVTAYLIRAAVKAIQLFPEVNSKWHNNYLEIFDQVNFGVGTALDSGGLVVPVILNAQAMDLMELSRALRAMTQKARSGKLTQADMHNGTFTLSNHGVSGSILAAPIILPQGQAAILGAGKMQKRVIVCETGGRELFRIRPMMYVTLTVDHRVLDGQQVNGFLTTFVSALEDPAQK